MLNLLDNLAAFLNSLHVQGNEVVVTLGQRLLQRFLNAAGSLAVVDEDAAGFQLRLKFLE